jgi:hypothetical protein
MRRAASLSLFAPCLIFLFANLSSAQSGAPNTGSPGTKWDILGVRIGSTVKEATAALKASIPNLVVSERSAALRSGDFETPRLLFGVVANSPQRDSHKVFPDEIVLVCDQVSSNKIIAISRHSRFTDNNKPFYDVLLKALVEKYGKPDIESDGQFYWFRNTSEKYKEPQKLEYLSSFLTGLASNEMSMGIFARKPDDIDKGCGTFLYCKIARSASNRILVDSIHCDLVDSVRLYYSYEYIITYMRTGAEAEAVKHGVRKDERGGSR